MFLRGAIKIAFFAHKKRLIKNYRVYFQTKHKRFLSEWDGEFCTHTHNNVNWKRKKVMRFLRGKNIYLEQKSRIFSYMLRFS
jgi:hypothetical protein